MQFAKTIQLPGDPDKYSISPEIKRYTLIDLGFEETKRGNFEYIGSVDTNDPFRPVAKLRILISGDMDGFKMETVTGNGMQKINIFKHPRAKEFVEQYHFILKEMLDRHVFTVEKG